MTAHKTACILCSLNCGLEVEVEDGHFVAIRGDREHPVSLGYQCQKATRLDYYQNSRQRLTAPLKRRADGGFEEISWRRAIAEIAAELVRIRDDHGGHALAYYGGGGQGNHMGGAHAGALRAAMGTRYIYNSLAQEKTGGFWLNGRMFGRQTCHPAEDVHHSDYVLFIGTNPWQAHGVQRARQVVNELARDPERTMVVVDPRRTETAERADVHLQVRPGGDAYLLLAFLGTIVQEGLADEEFLRRHTRGWERLRPALAAIPVDEYAAAAGIEPPAARAVARGFAAARAGCVRADLGLEHSLHSTLNCYLAKLLFLIPGHFGKPGTNNLHAYLMPLIGHSPEAGPDARRTRVTGMAEISKFYPPNILPLEIDTDHRDRVRGLVVDSSNPMVTAADTRAYAEAFAKLELLVTIDVAMTETARASHYVLPATSQYEKWEATFFNLEFPVNYFHLRPPLFTPAAGTLTEPEIYRRLVVAMGELPERFPLLERIARLDRRWPRGRLFPLALAATFKLRPRLRRYAALILHETLGAALPDGARVAAVLWGACRFFVDRHEEAVRRAGIRDRGAGLAEALFSRLLESPSGAIISEHEYADTFDLIRHPDRKIELEVPEMLVEIEELEAERRSGSEEPAAGETFPLVLIGGERRSYNANTIIREADWRRSDADGALKINAADAAALGLEGGDAAICESRRGRVEVRVEVTDEILPGVVSLPHGYGLDDGDGDDDEGRRGPRLNELTESGHCDRVAKTPFHKHIPVRVRALA